MLQTLPAEQAILEARWQVRTLADLVQTMELQEPVAHVYLTDTTDKAALPGKMVFALFMNTNNE